MTNLYYVKSPGHRHHLVDRDELLDALRVHGMHQSELQDHVADLDAGHVLHADDGTLFNTDLLMVDPNNRDETIKNLPGVRALSHDNFGNYRLHLDNGETLSYRWNYDHPDDDAPTGFEWSSDGGARRQGAVEIASHADWGFNIKGLAWLVVARLCAASAREARLPF